MTAYEKTMTSKGFFGYLFDWVTDNVDTPSEVVPWMVLEDTANALDFYYFYSWSGDKLISPMLEKIMKDDEENWKEDILEAFARTYLDQLRELWLLYVGTIDPNRTYDVHEETDYTHDGGGSVDDTGSDYRKKTGQVETTDSVWGIGSTTDKDSDKSITVYGEDGTPLQEEIKYGKSRTTTESATDDLDIHKYGNLGVIPKSEVVDKTRQTRLWNFYKKALFPMVDSYLTIPIY